MSVHLSVGTLQEDILNSWLQNCKQFISHTADHTADFNLFYRSLDDSDTDQNQAKERKRHRFQSRGDSK